MKKIVSIITVLLVFVMCSTCLAEPRIKIACFFDTNNDGPWSWWECFQPAYYRFVQKESEHATNGELIIIMNKDLEELFWREWKSGTSLSEIARKYNYDYVMKIYVQTPTEDVVHFRTGRYQKDFYDVLGIPMVCVIAAPNGWEKVVGSGDGGTETHGMLTRYEAQYICFANQIKGLIFTLSRVFDTYIPDDYADITEEEERAFHYDKKLLW